ncbi:MAG TPA: DoxX family protein [Candidatus Moranbacteria bacterium]|nr:MAG: hypothetical protein UW95_C0015G0012 [Parcubacteria group bacterium GW2011_GWC1_45_14]HAV10942.1 DoxX family protein [Candidatus Moranbacteria bacterium]
MEILFAVGQILFGGFFILNAFNHLTKLDGMSAYAKSMGVPMPKLAVAGSGLLILFGGLGVLLGIYVKLAALMLVLFLLPVSFQMHAFWKISAPGQRMGEMTNFLKNMALLGAALMLLAIPASSWVIKLF